MSILRSATKLHTSVRQCARLVVAAKQQSQRRGYADMAFTFASPVGVCICTVVIFIFGSSVFVRAAGS